MVNTWDWPWKGYDKIAIDLCNEADIYLILSVMKSSPTNALLQKGAEIKTVRIEVLTHNLVDGLAMHLFILYSALYAKYYRAKIFYRVWWNWFYAYPAFRDILWNRMNREYDTLLWTTIRISFSPTYWLILMLKHGELSCTNVGG